MTDGFVIQDGGEPNTSSTFLERLRQADDATWRRFVTVYTPLIYMWCRKAELQPADGVDVGQEVMISVARRIGTFEHNRGAGSFRGWLRVITRNKICDFMRARQNRPAAEGGSEAARRMEQITAVFEDPSPREESEEIQTVFQAALNTVRDGFEITTWKAFWEVAIEGRSPADVAESLGISVNSVYLAKSRVRRRLMQEFGGLIDFPGNSPTDDA